jgi:hypothetical protein
VQKHVGFLSEENKNRRIETMVASVSTVNGVYFQPTKEMESSFEISPWAVAIVLVAFDESQGQVIKSVYPPNTVFPLFSVLIIILTTDWTTNATRY